MAKEAGDKDMEGRIICGRHGEFVIREFVKRHYDCDRCAYRTASKFGFVRHMKRHHGEMVIL